MDILIVDDSKTMRIIVRRTLKQAGYAGYEVNEACDGKEALGKIRDAKPLLVLSDWNMPEMSGIELLDALRHAGIKVPFGFITSEGTDDMRTRATTSGALFLLVKPFTPDHVATALKPLLPPR